MIGHTVDHYFQLNIILFQFKLRIMGTWMGNTWYHVRIIDIIYINKGLK